MLLPSLLTSLSFIRCIRGDIILDIGSFIGCNAARMVKVVTFDGKETLSFKIVEHLQRNQIAFTSKMSHDEKFDHRLFHGHFYVLVADSRGNLSLALDYLADRAHNYTQKSFLMVYPLEMNNEDESLMRRTLIEQNKNVLFFMVTSNNTWQQVLTIKNQPQVVVNDLKLGKMKIGIPQSNLILLDDKFCVYEDYDLQGLPVISNSDEWKPFLYYTNCDKDGFSNCESHGFFYELTQMVAKK